ncbi:hypothetical protein AB0I93_18005 [Streptomyces sp. NPDC049967]|uniref:hypothetical protein n=1 Tax=Streptomyces sp. NPDC049967 TaxID=3155658 RepID=UPI00342DD2E7
MGHPHLPTTEAAVAAVREVARAYGLEMTVTDDIGADRTSRRASAGAFAVLDAGGALPHEAFIELGGTPVVTVQVFPEDDAKITVEGVEFNDIPRDSVPAFLRSVYGGTAHVKAKRFPAGRWLVVALPGDETYKELIARTMLSPWLVRSTRG